MTEIISDWEQRQADPFGDHIVQLRHRLAEEELFSEEGLIRLIERTPPERLTVNTMDARSHNPRSRREGVIRDLDGAAVMEAVRTGNIWLNIRKLGQTDPAYDRLLDRMFAEFEAKVPGLETFRRSMTVLISSPNLQVYYHCDVPGQMLWQIRGVKRVYVYPNTAPFLTQTAMEKVVLGEAHEVDMPYHPWYDEHATAIDLEPGRMLYWPLNCPHRIVNHDCVNVSVTTEHWTAPLRRAYAVNYANGLLRKATGAERLGRATSGPGFWGKAALAALVKASGVQAKSQVARSVDFAVDPSSPGGYRDVPTFALPR